MPAIFRAFLVASLGAFGLAGCYEELVDLTDEDEPGGAFVEGVSTTISGVVAKGFAYCDVIVREPVGTALSETAFRPAGVVVGQNFAVGQTPVPQPTADDVRFTLTVEGYVGPAIVEATNCSYEDELTALRFDIAMLRAPIVIPEEGGTLTAHVTPLTEMAYQVAVARADGVPQGITRSGIDAAYRLVTNGFAAGGAFDPLRTQPAVATLDTAADAGEDEVFYGLVLAAFSGALETTDFGELTTSLAEDLSAEGLRAFYGAFEAGAQAFDASQRNRAPRSASSVIAEVTGSALNPD